MEKAAYIGRYAPSPSGRLHLGNVLSSLLAWLDVRANGGTLIFRLEDLDPQRSYPEYAAFMAEDLLWLGLGWDKGWRPGAGLAYTQGARTALYRDAFDLLCRRGLVYPCYCSRAQRLAAPGIPRTWAAAAGNSRRSSARSWKKRAARRPGRFVCRTGR